MAVQITARRVGGDGHLLRKTDPVARPVTPVGAAYPIVARMKAAPLITRDPGDIVWQASAAATKGKINLSPSSARYPASAASAVGPKANNLAPKISAVAKPKAAKASAAAPPVVSPVNLVLIVLTAGVLIYHVWK